MEVREIEDIKIGLKNDFMFKKIFTDEKLLPYIKELFEALLGRQVKELTICKDLELEKVSRMDKFGRLDFKALVDEDVVNIEMQIKNEGNIEKRATYYGSKIFTSTIKEGIDYSKLRRTIVIVIANFNFIQNRAYHNKTITVIDDEKRDYILNNLIEYHYIELPKFRKIKPDLENKLSQWLMFIDNMNKEGVESVMKKNVNISKLAAKIKKLQGDEETQALLELHEKFELDYNSSMNYAKRTGHEQGFAQGLNQGLEQGLERGIEQGLERGIEQGLERGLEKGLNQGIEQGIKQSLEQVVKKMKKEKVSIELIIKVTGLTKKQIEKL